MLSLNEADTNTKHRTYSIVIQLHYDVYVKFFIVID